ncbi:uncharacterized protein An12g02010 [Aspergillus niger]|uniref:Contig An12c0060, genomic contig n=2 Tax=Aspergillus niger TaxID=5061 RepID=A2QYP8_ASPNC|nr:uncharacterized protein An12g02010 [Aspergillus niger]CAK48483.1 unnamed protein product [Aspergillus niger]
MTGQLGGDTICMYPRNYPHHETAELDQDQHRTFLYYVTQSVIPSSVRCTRTRTQSRISFPEKGISCCQACGCGTQCSEILNRSAKILRESGGSYTVCLVDGYTCVGGIECGSLVDGSGISNCCWSRTDGIGQGVNRASAAGFPIYGI